MGNKFEVWSWVMFRYCGDGTKLADPHYEIKYEGDKLWRALFIIFREKIRGIGCVKFYYR